MPVTASLDELIGEKCLVMINGANARGTVDAIDRGMRMVRVTKTNRDIVWISPVIIQLIKGAK